MAFFHSAALCGLISYLVHVTRIEAAGYHPDTGFTLGIYGPFTNWNHDHVATAVAFDLDLRKNFEPEVAARFGPPVINITNLHPALKVSVQIGTSNSQPDVGTQTALDWLQGSGGSDPVVGIVGGIISTIAMPIASIAAVFKVPQIAWGSSSPLLSDKARYPFFSRTVPPDTVLSLALWAWKTHFYVPSVVVLFTREAFGSGMYDAIQQAADAKGEIGLVTGVGVDYMPESLFDIDVAAEACDRVKASGKRFIMLGILSRAQILHVMEKEGLLYSTQYQVMGNEGSIPSRTDGLFPSRGWPVGYHRFKPADRGVLFDRFADLWSRINTEDIYGEPAMQRYKMHLMQVPLLRESSVAVSNASFERDHILATQSKLPFIFDAAYSFVIAINNLLHKGETPDNVKGQLLLDEIRGLRFEGITGEVTFDASGDRKADYELWTIMTGLFDFKKVAVINAAGAVNVMDSDEVIWQTGTSSSRAPDSYKVCNAGEQWTPFIGRCSACSSGFISTGGVLAECSACPPGTTSSTNATACIPCAPGWFNAVPGSPCSQCSPGTFSNSPGTSVCLKCAVGSFSEETGASACETCGAGRASERFFTTMNSLVVDGSMEYSYVLGADSQSFCGCDRGFRVGSSGECVSCTEGMMCKGLGSVYIEEGYYAQEDLSVYRCFGDTERCSGGLPGQTCKEGREALTCAECEEDKTPGSDGKCIDCNDSDKAPFFLMIILMVAALVVTYHIIDKHNRATQSHALLLCSFAIAQLVTVTQQMSIIGMISVEWKDPIKWLFGTISLLAFDLNALRLSCVGTVKPITRYVVKVLAIFVGILIMLVIHAMFVSIRYKGNFRERRPTLVAAIGTIFMIFYIAVTSAILEPLQCQEHPNGKWTVRVYPTITCWESGQHVAMLITGCIAFVLVPLGFLLNAAKIVRDFPRRMREGDSEAVRAFSFLFFRFRPGCHTYVIIHLLRSFLLAFVLLVPTSMLQVLLMSIILLISFGVTVHWMPWRVYYANILDALFGIMTVLLLMVSVAYIPEEDKNLDSIAEVSMVFICLLLLLVPGAIGYGLWRKFFRIRKPFQFFLCHHKLGSGAWTRLLKLHLLDSGKVKTDVFIDTDNLDHLDRLFSYVGHDTGTLVAVATQDILKRPWCMGEMCTARMKSVKTVVLAFPDFELPEDHFIAGFNEQVGNYEVLIECGLTLEDLQTTLRWLGTLARVTVPATMNVQIMDAVVEKLFSNLVPNGVTLVDSGRRSSERTSREGMKSESMLLCSRDDTESLATGFILIRLLAASLANEYEKIPKMIEDKTTITGDAITTLVVCTNRAFTRIAFLKLLAVLKSARTHLLPVIAEVGFQIPGKGFAEQLHSMLLPDEEVPAIVAIVGALFRMIGCPFQPASASESVLRVSAAEIAKHIKGMATTTLQGSSASVLPMATPKISTGDKHGNRTSSSWTTQALSREHSQRMSAVTSHSDYMPVKQFHTVGIQTDGVNSLPNAFKVLLKASDYEEFML